jgi:hypothetical protein
MNPSPDNPAGVKVRPHPYTGCNHLHGHGVILSMGNPSFKLVDTDGTWWLVEWHHYFGPASLDKRTENPRKNQPGEKSRFWMLAKWWEAQGGVVVDGVGQWKEPPKIRKQFWKIGRQLFESVPEGVTALGDVVTIEYYEGELETIQVIKSRAVPLQENDNAK